MVQPIHKPTQFEQYQLPSPLPDLNEIKMPWDKDEEEEEDEEAEPE
jgi:hypothetical protein